jgi:3-hydroxyacyl-CoA dehydrogenase
VRRERGIVDASTNLSTNPVVRYHGGLGDRMVEAGRLGHKTMKGWYNYDPKKQKDANYCSNGMKIADPETVTLLMQHRKSLGIVARPRAEITRQEIEERCLFGLVNEVSSCGCFLYLILIPH